jgi:hypothetical protein
LLLANPGADREWYRNKLGLNNAQLEHVISMAKRKELLIVQGGIAKALQLNERPERRKGEGSMTNRLRIATARGCDNRQRDCRKPNGTSADSWPESRRHSP